MITVAILAQVLSVLDNSSFCCFVLQHGMEQEHLCPQVPLLEPQQESLDPQVVFFKTTIIVGTSVSIGKLPPNVVSMSINETTTTRENGKVNITLMVPTNISCVVLVFKPFDTCVAKVMSVTFDDTGVDEFKKATFGNLDFMKTTKVKTTCVKKRVEISFHVLLLKNGVPGISNDDVLSLVAENTPIQPSKRVPNHDVDTLYAPGLVKSGKFCDEVHYIDVKTFFEFKNIFVPKIGAPKFLPPQNAAPEIATEDFMTLPPLNAAPDIDKDLHTQMNAVQEIMPPPGLTLGNLP